MGPGPSADAANSRSTPGNTSEARVDDAIEQQAEIAPERVPVAPPAQLLTSPERVRANVPKPSAGFESAYAPTERSENTLGRTSGQRALGEATTSAATIASTSWFLVSPDAGFFRIWDPLIMIMLLITATLTPYEVAFLEGFTTDYDALWWCNRIIDVCFIIDMGLQFVVVRWISTKRRYTHSLQETGWRYLQGWFIVDFVSVFPWEILGGLLDDDNVSSLALLRIFRLFRLLKLVRLVRASRILKRWEASLELRYSVMHLCYFLLLCVAVSHWLACLWRLSVDDLDRLDSWIGQSRLTLDVQSPLSVYITSLYFSVYCVTTAGFGDITPQNETERLVAILTMAAGASIYAYSVGSVSAIVASMDEASNAFHQTMDNLNAWMDEVCIPSEMRSELRRYFHHTRSLARENTYRRLLSHMSPTLRMRVASHCHAAWVREVAFLASTQVPMVERDAFVMELSLKLVPVSFAPDEAIIRHNEPATSLYIVKRGLVIRSLPQFKLTAQCDFRVGWPKVIGADFIMMRYFRPYSVRTLTFLDGYSLDKKVVDQLLRHDEFPNTKAVLRRHAISSALKAKLPALALTFALMSRLRYGSFDGEPSDDDELEDVPAGKVDHLETTLQHSSVEQTPVYAIRPSATRMTLVLDAHTARPPLAARPGKITHAPERDKDMASKRRLVDPGSPPSRALLRSLGSTSSSSDTNGSVGGSGVPVSRVPALPANAARRGSNSSISSTGRQPASLNEHALAKQVNNSWEQARALLSAMGRGASNTVERVPLAVTPRSTSFSDAPPGAQSASTCARLVHGNSAGAQGRQSSERLQLRRVVSASATLQPRLQEECGDAAGVIEAHTWTPSPMPREPPLGAPSSASRSSRQVTAAGGVAGALDDIPEAQAEGTTHDSRSSTPGAGFKSIASQISNID